VLDGIFVYIYIYYRYSAASTRALRAFVITDSCTYLIKFFLTPFRRVLLEKLTGFQPFKKLPAFYGTQNFITAVTSAGHLPLP
jgi:hypothetical protein